MSAVLRVHGSVAQGWEPDAPTWLQSFDIDAHDGQGEAWVTVDLAFAHRFPDARAALEAWRAIPAARPTRPDGKPNRPLTTFTVEVETVEDP